MRDTTALHPTLQTKLAELKTKCAAQGLKIGIGECVRTVAEQDALYAQGRTTSGSIVTNAKGSSYSSMHQWGVAFDFYRNDGTGAYNDSDGFFSKVGKIGQGLGLEWGGAWTSIVDKPHFQLPDWGSGPSKLKKLYGTPEKFKAAWPKATTTATAAATTTTATQTTTQTKKEDDIVTQTEFNKMMDTYLEQRNALADATWGSEWEKAKAWAEEQGIIKGDQYGNKMYQAWATRQALVLLLYRWNQEG